MEIILVPTHCARHLIGFVRRSPFAVDMRRWSAIRFVEHGHNCCSLPPFFIRTSLGNIFWLCLNYRILATQFFSFRCSAAAAVPALLHSTKMVQAARVQCTKQRPADEGKKEAPKWWESKTIWSESKCRGNKLKKMKHTFYARGTFAFA